MFSISNKLLNDGHIQAISRAKNVHIDVFKDAGIRMQLSRLILLMKTQFVNFIAR